MAYAGGGAIVACRNHRRDTEAPECVDVCFVDAHAVDHLSITGGGTGVYRHTEIYRREGPPTGAADIGREVIER